MIRPTIKFPSDIPLVESLQIKPIKTYVVSEQLPRSSRSISSHKGSIVEVSWILTGNQMSSFESFHKDSLYDGTRWFTMKLPSALGYLKHVCRFVKLNPKSKVGLHWRISAVLEIFERRTEFIIKELQMLSSPYPQVALDGIESSIEVLSTALGFAGVVESLDALLITSRTMYVDLHNSIQNTSPQPDSTWSVLGLQSGRLVDAIKTVNIQQDATNSNQQVLSVTGGLRMDYQALDGLESALTVIGGELL